MRCVDESWASLLYHLFMKLLLKNWRKESRKRVMLGHTPNPNADHSALVTRRTNNSGGTCINRQGRPWCEHCHKKGYTKDTCWKLHGKPADWKPRNLPDNHGLIVEKNGQISFTPEQIEQLQQFLNHAKKPKPQSFAFTCSVNNSGNISTTLTANASSWIIDSGASDHMTGQSQQFTTYTPCPGAAIRVDDWECEGM